MSSSAPRAYRKEQKHRAKRASFDTTFEPGPSASLSHTSDSAHPPLRSKKKVQGLSAFAASSRKSNEDDVNLDSGRTPASKGRSVVPFVDAGPDSPSPKHPKGGHRRGKINGDEGRENYSGGLAVAEFERLRKEVEALKKVSLRRLYELLPY
jgi:hypothetical protein